MAMNRSPRIRLATVGARTLAVVVVVAAVLAAAPRPAHAAGAITCHYYTVGTWLGGFSADLAITNNTATTVNGWTAAWSFDAATFVNTTWNGTITQGTPFDATARNATYNAVIPPGTSMILGWTATATATGIPAAIVVNGTDCPMT